jgi:hypothetical protein
MTDDMPKTLSKLPIFPVNSLQNREMHTQTRSPQTASRTTGCISLSSAC